MLLFNPNIVIRVTIISVTVGVLIGVVAASIAIAVILPKTFPTTQVIVRADMYVALYRPVASYEQDVLYSRRQTLHDIIDGLNKEFSQAFLKTFINFVVTAFSGKPILLTDTGEKPQDENPSIVTVNATIYFDANYTGNDILSALKNYSQLITLLTWDGQPSTKLATFSMLYSRCTDTYSDSRRKDVVEELLSIDVTDPTTTPISATATPMTITPYPSNTSTNATFVNVTPMTITAYTSNTSTNATFATATPMTITAYTYNTSSNATFATATPITITPYTSNTSSNATSETATPITITPYTPNTSSDATPTPTPTLTPTHTPPSYTSETATNTTSDFGNANSTCKPIFAINMTVALERSTYPNELPQFYERYNSRLDLFDTIYSQLEEYFSDRFLTFTMVDISDEPVLIADSILEGTDEVGTDEYAYDALPTTKLTTKKSIVIIHGALLSKEYITNEDISNAFQDFTAPITLITPDGESSRYPSSFDNEYSSFQNMSRVEFTDGNTNFSICWNSSCDNFTLYSTPTVRNITAFADSANQSVFKADIHLYLVSNITDDGSSYLYDTSNITDTIFNQFLSYFPDTLINVVVSNITDNPSSRNVNSRKKRDSGEVLSSIAVDATVYFALDHTKEEIINVFQDYSLLIYYMTESGEPIVAAGNVSMDYSTFTDTYLIQIPRLENTILNCIYLA
ncbi:unnamed protein product [Adineta steineri]|uniref:Uncharacterized protein n=1 Tax=Adineta steineri TaxID=433720 RepID=A0A818X108_9BILA|nr:unnamed protein product [Adineta steineri]CAF3731103.1 unnamed protein product [Adineta steineri]